jgi:hypothetical protein
MRSVDPSRQPNSPTYPTLSCRSTRSHTHMCAIVCVRACAPVTSGPDDNEANVEEHVNERDRDGIHRYLRRAQSCRTRHTHTSVITQTITTITTPAYTHVLTRRNANNLTAHSELRSPRRPTLCSVTHHTNHSDTPVVPAIPFGTQCIAPTRAPSRRASQRATCVVDLWCTQRHQTRSHTHTHTHTHPPHHDSHRMHCRCRTSPSCATPPVGSTRSVLMAAVAVHTHTSTHTRAAARAVYRWHVAPVRVEVIDRGRRRPHLPACIHRRQCLLHTFTTHTHAREVMPPST